jgi:cyclopropane fatty-acyl-phospholipid synthase-like methyltransferase
VPPGAHVLEIGAGYCDWINHTRAARRLAVDAWSGVCAHAAAGVQAQVLDLTQGLEPVGRSAFDVVLASNVLEHFEPDTAAAVVRAVAAVLRPGGRLIVIQPNFRYAWRHYFDDYTHRSVFTDRSLPALLRACGFGIDRVEPRFLPYSMQRRRVPAWPWLVQAYLRSPVRPLAGQMLVVGRKE